MRHLIELNHKCIAYIGEEPGTQSNAFADYVEIERFGAYRDIMSSTDSWDEQLVRFARPKSPEHIPGTGHGYTAMRDLLSERQDITAVLASSDMIAAGVLQAIREVGLSIPEDISVIGFDDTLSEYLSPLLTTVRLPAQELGQTAAKLLIDQLEGKGNQRGQLIELDAELIVRQSTAKA